MCVVCVCTVCICAHMNRCVCVFVCLYVYTYCVRVHVHFNLMREEMLQIFEDDGVTNIPVLPSAAAPVELSCS